MLLGEPLAGDQPQPEVGRRRAVAGVVGQPGGQVEIGILEDIRGVDTTLQPAIEPRPDHLSETPSMTFPERSQCRFLSRSSERSSESSEP